MVLVIKKTGGDLEPRLSASPASLTGESRRLNKSLNVFDLPSSGRTIKIRHSRSHSIFSMNLTFIAQVFNPEICAGAVIRGTEMGCYN